MLWVAHFAIWLSVALLSPIVPPRRFAWLAADEAARVRSQRSKRRKLPGAVDVYGIEIWSRCIGHGSSICKAMRPLSRPSVYFEIAAAAVVVDVAAAVNGGGGHHEVVVSLVSRRLRSRSCVIG